MKTEKEIRARGEKAAREYERFSWSRDDNKIIMNIIQWILDDELVGCPVCRGSGMIVDYFNKKVLNYHCPVCDKTGKMTTLRKVLFDERDKMEIEQVKEEWGI